MQIQTLNKKGLNHKISVTKGILKDGTSALLTEFFSKKRNGNKK